MSDAEVQELKETANLWKQLEVELLSVKPWAAAGRRPEAENDPGLEAPD